MAGAGRHPARNLQVVLGLAGLLYAAWSWADFSGPFRLFVDLQLRFFDRYSEPAAGIASAIVMAAAVALAVVLVERVLPELSATASDRAVAIVFAAASAAAVWQVWHLWNEAAHMPRLGEPLRVVDLGTVGSAALPTGHVRVIGTPDRQRQVLVHTTGRYGLNSRWESWVPLIARQQGDAAAPVRIAATAVSPDRSGAALAVGDDPEGLLLSGSVDTRTIYEARQEGLAMDERSFALYLDERVRLDRFINAALLGSFVALFWGLAAYGRITGRSGRATPTVSASAPPTDMAQAPGAPASTASTATTAAPGPEPATAADGRLTRYGTGAAIAAAGAGGLLWEMYGFFPSSAALLGYAAAAVTLALALLMMWLGQRHDAAEPAAGPRPTLGAPMAALVPPPGAALLCVLRDEPGASSPSYKRVDVDGERVADLKANRYTVVPLRPGPHRLAVNTRASLTSDTITRFDAAAGDVVVYRMQVPFFGAMRLERTADLPAVRAALARLKPAEPP